MPLVYITGVSGSGKSTVRNALQKLGYTAYDVDDTAISGVFDNNAGEKIAMPPVDQRNPQWFAEHNWLIMPEAVAKLKAESRDRLIFLCGAAHNDREFWQSFDKAICLDVSEAALRQRIAERQDNDYGKNKQELQSILDWHKNATAAYKKLGAYVVDANLPLDIVIKKILRLTAD